MVLGVVKDIDILITEKLCDDYYLISTELHAGILKSSKLLQVNKVVHLTAVKVEDVNDTPFITSFSFSKCKEVTKKLSLKPVAFTDPVEAKDGFLSFVGRVIRKNASNLVLLSFKKEQIKINTNMEDEINVEENKVYEFCLLKKKQKSGIV